MGGKQRTQRDLFKAGTHLAGAALTCALLSACGGSNSGSSTEGEVAIDEYPNLEKSTIEATELRYATEDELLNHLKNGIRLSVYIHDFEHRDLGIPVPEPVPAATAAPDSSRALDDAVALTASSDSESFSETNTHVAGVDEADYIKYDGEHLFLSASAEWVDDQRIPARIRILQSTPEAAEIDEVATIDMDDDGYWNPVDELYLVEDEAEGGTDALVSIRSAWDIYSVGEPFMTLAADFITTTNEAIELRNYDVSDASDPELSSTLEIDGYLIDSRKIGNTLYVVSRYSADLPFIDYYVSEEEAAENEARISALTLDDFLPKISVDGGEKQNILTASDCLLPTTINRRRGYPSLTAIMAIDLNDMSVTSAKCLNTQVSGIYANGDSLYIGGSAYTPWERFESFTVFHKFLLGDSLDYRSTGIAPGTLGWRDAAFRMDEYNDSFRVITSARDSVTFDWVHRLTIFQDNPTTDKMEIVAQLPNEASPAAIGKPGEDIFAVRFAEDRAFIVTFQRIDPLYVLDISDPLAPSIAGELELPGFSTYLHPVDDDYLLGIGQDADDNGRVNGVQVNLFDISDISNPSLIANEVFGGRGTWSPALSNLRAISFLRPTIDQLRFSFPISLHATNDSYQWEDDSLHLFEVNGLASSSANLIHVGKVIAEAYSEENPWPNYSGLDRSALDGEAVYYSHGNSVWSAFWSSPNAATGPH